VVDKKFSSQKQQLVLRIAVFVAVIGFFASVKEANAQFTAPTPSANIPVSENSALNIVAFSHSFFSPHERTDIPGLEEQQAPAPAGSHKSPYLAAGLSLVLPGLGEYYVGDEIWRGVIFTAVDAALLAGNIIYNKRGDDSLTAFHAWADSLWSSNKYADSLNMLLAYIHDDFRITDGNNFSQINMAEDTLAYSNISPLPVSHRLPQRGSQQYYELISKYIQFTYGWLDAKDAVPEHSYYYERHAEMRANMNETYITADYFLYGMILNRVLSAIDAVLLAKDHNSAVRLQGELQTYHLPDGRLGYVPTAKLNVRF
jgi:hypothetical protein